jgi:site-specific recombinase XerD
MANGRLEKELKAEEKMKRKLLGLPSVFTEFYYALEGEGKSYTTLNNYINHNIDFMNYIMQGKLHSDFYINIKAAQINQYMASIRKKEVNGQIIRMGDDIRAARWSSINAFFEFLKENDYISENPMDKTKRPKIKTEHKVTYLNHAEIASVLNKVKAEASAKKMSRDLCIISLALSTGLRVSAITQIDLDDINFSNNTIAVIEKGGKVREINFGNNLRQLLINYMNDRDKCFSRIDTNALFVSQWGKRITPQAIRDLVAKYTKDIQGKHITPHKLRASAATNLAANGTSIQAIASILGHENIQTTRRYVEVLDTEKNAAINILDNLI